MIEIIPFKGIRYRYNGKDLARVLAPPYDVISPAQQIRYYRKHPYNVIRLILGKSLPRDIGKRNRYQRAARFLNLWLKKGILVREAEPGIYFLQEQYKLDRVRKMRWGFVALLRLKSPHSGEVLFHEHTLRKPKEDRARLLRATRANFSPLFGLYRGKCGTFEELSRKISKYPAAASYLDGEGVGRKTWEVTDRDIIQKIIKEIRPKQIFIADGHHRYEVNWGFSQIHPTHKFVMMYFTNVNDHGLTILPVHRIVHLEGGRIENLELKISKFFSIKKVGSRQKMFNCLKENCERHCFGMYYQGRYYFLQFKGPKPSLDGEILDQFVLKEVLKIDAGDRALAYTRDSQAVGQLVFFLNPTKVEEVVKFALEHKIMPPKSTYFYPKLPSGLMIYQE